jgi:hypothetical protein
MSDGAEGIIAGIIAVLIVLFAIAVSVKASERGIASSCQLSKSFVVDGKAYKCELMK